MHNFLNLPLTYYQKLSVLVDIKFGPAIPSILLHVALFTSCLPLKAATMSEQLSLPFVKSTNVTRKGCAADVKSKSPASPAVLEWKALPPDLIVGPYTLAEVELARKTESTKFLAARVMARLQQAEAHEVDRHLREDYRQAWITLSFLQKDVPDAFVQASYRMYGLHPQDVWPAIVADRKARLGAEYHDWYTSDDLLRPDVPKIPPTSSAAPPTNRAAANGADLLRGLGPVTVGPIPKGIV